MKRIFFALCVFFTLIITANAGGIYSCIDRDGKTIITNNPQYGMSHCVLKESSTKPPPEETSTSKTMNIDENNNDADKEQDKPEEPDDHISKCISCCNDKVTSCYNYSADRRLCSAENENCIATCNSAGSSLSAWSDCWFQSVK